MSPAEIMIKFGFLDWKSMLLGIENGWLSAQELIFEIDKKILEGETCSHVLEISISGSNKKRIVELLSSHLIEIGGSIDRVSDPESFESKHWRFCILKSIIEGPLSNTDKIEKIQEVYAEFGFPEDMIACTPYYFSPVERTKIGKDELNFVPSDPLTSAENLLNQMKKEFVTRSSLKTS